MDRRRIGLGIKLSLAVVLTIIALGNVVLLVVHGRSEWVLYIVAGFIALFAAQAWYQFVLARRGRGRRSAPESGVTGR